jgi:hypothetical protein
MALTKVVYAPLVQVQSGNLNDIQDEIIADELRITALETSAETVPIHASSTAGVVNCTWQNVTSRYWQSNAAPAEVVMSIDAAEGTSITAWTVDIRDTPAQVTARLFKATKNAALTAVDVAVLSIGNTSDQTLSQTLASPEMVAANTYYIVKMDFVAVGMRFYGGSYDRSL